MSLKCKNKDCKALKAKISHNQVLECMKQRKGSCLSNEASVHCALLSGTKKGDRIHLELDTFVFAKGGDTRLANKVIAFTYQITNNCPSAAWFVPRFWI